jgi:plastocyanin
VRRTLTILVLVAATSALAAGCADAGGNDGTTAPATPAAPAGGSGSGGGGGAEPTSSRSGGGSGSDADTDVRIENFVFAPKMLQAEVGQRVKWQNQDVGVTHTVTADQGGFRSGDLTGGKAFSHVFRTAGGYAYHCAIHADMRGTVRVGG